MNIIDLFNFTLLEIIKQLVTLAIKKFSILNIFLIFIIIIIKS